MIFTTLQFIGFLAIVLPLYFSLHHRWRVPLLLAASYYFYMCSVPWYLTVIVAITLIDYFAGIWIEQARSQAARSAFLGLSIASNFGILFVFKYAGFFADNINGLFGSHLPILRAALPLGLSFHTFQAVSYTIEVYRRRCPAERNLMYYALYVAFFPQMVAGPIERPYNLLPQFRNVQPLAFENLRAGALLMLWGAFKKIGIADLVAPVVKTVYAAPQQFSGPVLLLATFFFAVQIYCDFSGYTDIAIGVARIMGFRLATNFRQPYFASTIADFWHRWHISLSTWFRDYLYIPLGGSRVSTGRRYVNIMLVFIVSGLWHGANWTFVVWGTLHGLYLVAGDATAPMRLRLKAALGLRGPVEKAADILLVFVLVTLAWVFFRAATVRDGIYVISHIFNVRGFHFADIFAVGLPRFEMLTAFGLIGFVAAAEWFMAFPSEAVDRVWTLRPVRWTGYFACVFGIVFFGVFGGVEFIYFQF